MCLMETRKRGKLLARLKMIQEDFEMEKEIRKKKELIEKRKKVLINFKLTS